MVEVWGRFWVDVDGWGRGECSRVAGSTTFSSSDDGTRCFWMEECFNSCHLFQIWSLSSPLTRIKDTQNFANKTNIKLPTYSMMKQDV